MAPSRWIVLLVVPLWSPTWADTLAVVRVAGGEIRLLTEDCATPDSRIQRALMRTGGRRLEGCWSVNARGNPVIMWGDGRVQEVAESRVQLAPKYIAMLEDRPAGGGPPDAPPAGAAPGDFPRPSWCQDARFPHEKLVCRDPELAAADIALAPLWRSYRDQRALNAVQQGRLKSDYLRRLKVCGADKPCVQREQAAQARFYRESLPRR